MHATLRRSMIAAALAAGLVVGLVIVPFDAPASAAHRHALSASLLGAKEVPSDSGDQDAVGVALVDIRTNSGKLCYVIWVSDVDGAVNGAHLHLGAAGEEGPAVADLDAPVWKGAMSGCTRVDADLAADLWASPADFYVNVHSTAFPDGAIRGQLRRFG